MTNGRRAWASIISTASWAARPTNGRHISSRIIHQIFPWIGRKDYNLTTDMADEAIKYMRDAERLRAGQAILCLLCARRHAFAAPAKQEWIEKFKGKFDMGYEKMRDQIFANQKKLGVIPPDTQLTPWPDGQDAMVARSCRDGTRSR